VTPKSTCRCHYWLVVGTEPEPAARLDILWKKYFEDHAE